MNQAQAPRGWQLSSVAILPIYDRDGRTVTRSVAGGDDFDTQRSAASGDRK